MSTPSGAGADRRLLVLVTGTGRSGTSTIAGTLHHLGLSVPGPYLGANASNPKGFYESKWATTFHKELADTARINVFDSRPWAFDRAQRAVTADLRARLVDFVGQFDGEAQVVVKDPRSVWAQRLWKEAAAEVGRDIGYVSMLRHPAEVVGSRTTYYAKGDSEDDHRRYATFNVARWVNSCVISERETRGERRSFVGYADLLEDWRPVLARVRDELGLTFDDDLDPGHETPVDAFIEPGLRRHRPDWAELDVPDALRDLAQAVWDELAVVAQSPSTPSARLDELSASYSTLISEAAAVAHDVVGEARATGEAAGAARAREEARARREREAAKRAKAQRAPKPLAERPVSDVGARDLLRIAGGRALARVRRR